ncbi:hypothetical protein ACFTZB_29870 [Rhodococcus sp. NPDC057014]|uniref:hypothetical protein n=1 Tax=Rhodococcus sp. NPDC057014 TaxID=3346000 RepID=UPI003626893E
MDESAHHHTDRLEDSAEVSDDAPTAPVRDEQRDEVLARAVIDALADGMTWEQIGARLGVPRPSRHDAVTDREWQDAIVDHENARAQRIQRRPQESPHHHHAPKPPRAG